MKTPPLSTAYLFTLTALLTACQPNADVGKDGKTLDVAALVDDIEARIKPDVWGYTKALKQGWPTFILCNNCYKFGAYRVTDLAAIIMLLNKFSIARQLNS